jgi:hypothetical protein
MVKPETKAGNTAWLELPAYHVVPLKPQLAEHVIGLERGIRQGIPAYPDVNRKDFFDLQLESGWVYIHVHADSCAVYLVAHSVSRFFSSPSSRMSAGNERELDLSAVILSRALHDEPNFAFVIPDERERRAVLPWFFRTLAFRASHVCGEIYTTNSIDGVALWISPGRARTFGRMLRMGMLTVPFRLGRAGFRRCLSLSNRLEQVHERLASGPHWYLMALGVEPPDQRHVIRGALIEPVLSRADSEGLPCYLETFDPANLPFYKKRGFRIEGAGRIPGGGPNYWALVRAPREASRAKVLRAGGASGYEAPTQKWIKASSVDSGRAPRSSHRFTLCASLCRSRLTLFDTLVEANQAVGNSI